MGAPHRVCRCGCGKPVPPDRRYYASDECRRRAKYSRLAEQIGELKSVAAEMEAERLAKLKPRRCLRCQRMFPSEGNWNRVCPLCECRNHRISSRIGLSVLGDGAAAERGFAEKDF